MLTPWKSSYDKPRQGSKKQRHHFADKGLHNQSFGFSSIHVWMWELDHEEGWVPKNWHFRTGVLENILQCPSGSKETKPVNPKGNQSLNIHWKDCCWSSNILAIWCEELTHWKNPWCWERLKARGKGGDRGWDGWSASLT